MIYNNHYNPIMLRWLGEWVRGLTVGLLLLDLHVHFFWGGSKMNNLELSRRVTEILPEGFCGFKYFIWGLLLVQCGGVMQGAILERYFSGQQWWVYRQPPNFVEHPSRDIGIPFWLVASMCKFFDLSFSLSAKLKLFWAGSGWAKVMSLSQLDKFFTCGEP